MSKEMTAEEYKEHFDQGLIPFIRESTKTYGDLRAKEAVKEFAWELMEYFEDVNDNHIVFNDHIKQILKDKGIKI